MSSSIALTRDELVTVFDRWEQDYRANPSTFLTEAECRAMETATLAERCAITFEAHLRQVKDKPAEDPPLCVNCAHYTERKNMQPACGHPDTPHDLVYGQPYTSCAENREFENLCGSAGRRHQPSTKVGEARVHGFGKPIKGV